MRDKLVIHTHDRLTFKRCRRKWQLSSPWCNNLAPIEKNANIHLWFGSGFHYALEDYHGYNKFGHPCAALEAYFNAFSDEERPLMAQETFELGIGMLEYYLKWLQNKEVFETLWLNDKPMVECSFELQIPELTEYAKSKGVAEMITYHGTIDKIVTDTEGRWWLVDYKTASTIDTKKLATDPQISAYLWATEQYLDHDIEGMIFMQFAKDVPHPPKRLAKGGFSKDKRQTTLHGDYCQALLEEFGEVPQEYVEILNELAMNETLEGNRYIRWDKVERNNDSKESTYQNILEEGYDMIDQLVQARCYPNQTRDCAWDCPFRMVCIAQEEGHDYKELLVDNFEVRVETAKGERDKWRTRIKYPTL